MRLRESRHAAAELDAIFEYGVANHGIDAAIAYIDEVKRRYRQLLDYPRSGRAEPELGPTMRSISYKPHRIYYEIIEDTIVIQRILHQAADVKEWME
jgi:toxin ParE1/3/4